MTARQAEVYRAILDYVVETATWPTWRELARRLDMASHNGLTCHLEALEKQGLVKVGSTGAKSRTITIPDVAQAMRNAAKDYRGEHLSCTKV